jgi:hypothetical protein
MKDTFSTVSVQFMLTDMNKWLITRLNHVDSSRSAKPQDAFYDRGMIQAFREVQHLIQKTLTVTTND